MTWPRIPWFDSKHKTQPGNGSFPVECILMAATAAATSTAIALLWREWNLSSNRRKDAIRQGSSKNEDHVSAYEALIGNTPIVRLEHLSKLLQRSILVKMECLNPGGTGKDRAALSMIRAAEQSQQLPPPYHSYSSTRENPRTFLSRNSALPTISTSNTTMSKLDETIELAGQNSRTGGIVVEGTSGSTGISLATLAASRGHGCIVVLPDDQAAEKRMILSSLGAQVHVVPTASISNPHHYVNVARRIAERATSVWGYRAVFIDQFENMANFQIHYEETGPEVWNACPHLDAFVMSSGTGGTIAGAGKYLKEKSKGRAQIVLVDPPGSSLYHKIEHGVAYAPQQAEQRLKRHRYDTIAEGIGLDRITCNFEHGEPYIDKAIRVEDQAALDMAHWLLKNEGLFVGSSSSMNVVGAIVTASALPIGSTVMTVICDTGQRHVTRFWNRDFCTSWGLLWPGDSEVETIPQCLQSFVGATTNGSKH